MRGMSHCTERQVEIWKVRVLMLASINFRSLFVREEVTRKWRKLHNKELSDLYSSPNILREIKSRRIRWTGNVAHMGENYEYIHGFAGETWEKETNWKTQV